MLLTFPLLTACLGPYFYDFLKMNHKQAEGLLYLTEMLKNVYPGGENVSGS